MRTAERDPTGERPASAGASRIGRLRSGVRRWWPALRIVLGFGIAAAALWALSSHTGELAGLPAVLDHLNWAWIFLAIGAEFLSFSCFAAMQGALLRCGGLEVPRGPLLKMTFASQALASSLPGGTAVAAVYGFRWFRRFGADGALAGWATAGTVVASAVSLSLVATAGLALAASEGASLDLIPAIVGALLLAALVGALFVYERPLYIVISSVLRTSHVLVGRPRGDTTAQIDRIVRSITSVRLGWRQVGTIVLLGTANWLFDCACFAMMFAAVHASIPWKGLLLAYGAGQLAAALPITPGGLGAVEGSITIALVAFGGAQTTTVDSVLLYRMISFWLVLIVGWALLGELAVEVWRGRWQREALMSPVTAGLGAAEAGGAPSASMAGPPSGPGS
jgi:putative heme transporter